MEGWLPPIEARPEGTVMAAPRRRLTEVRIACLALVALMIVGVVALRAHAARGHTPQAVARAFVDAHASGDAAAACRQLTVRARRDMVALVRGIEKTEASASDCERYVLTTSERSIFTDPALRQFRGRDMAVRVFANREGAVIRAKGLGEEPFLEAVPVRGGWKLDGLGAERASFLAGCTDHGGVRAACACMFARLAQRGVASSDEFGRRGPELVAEAAPACARYSARSQPK
jgi:hypothetical protein